MEFQKKKKERIDQIEISSKISSVTETILYDKKFHDICIRTCLNIVKGADVGKMEEKKLKFGQRFQIFLGLGGFRKDLIIHKLKTPEFESFQRRLAIYHVMGLIKYL